MSRDDRFYTPRATARSGGYASSSDEGGAFSSTPRAGTISSRSWTSDQEYQTPREISGYSSSEGGDDWSDATSRHGRKMTGGGAVAMPFLPGGRTVDEEYKYSNSSSSSGSSRAGAGASSTDSYYGSTRYDGTKSSYGYHSHTYTEDESKTASTNSSYHLSTSSSAAAAGVIVNESDVANIFSYARHGRAKDVESLLDRGVPVNIRDKHGNTILTVACQNGVKKVAKLALRRGADINQKNNKGNTPLHFCFTYGYGETLGHYLISKGADPSITNNYGYTAQEGAGGSK